MPTVEINSIRVESRHRKKMGDIAALAASIIKVGLLHPIVVTPDLRLVAGERRLRALQHLGHAVADVTIVENLDAAAKLLIAERDENTCRLALKPTEAAALGRELEALERPKAKERQNEGQQEGRNQKHRKNKEFLVGGNLPPTRNEAEQVAAPVAPEHKDSGKTRDKVAEAVGMSGRTYDKARAVVAAAEANPEQFGDLPAKMDAGSVNAAFQEMKARQDADAADEPPREVLLDIAHQELPPQAVQAFSELPILRQLIAKLDACVKECEAISKLAIGRCLHADSAKSQIKAARQTLRAGRPAYVCPYCRGQDAECTGCKGAGWVTVGTFKQSPPEMQTLHPVD